mmetsp:Transcript_41115/g.129157  ORF Transcript_41115/g.129157 Transcript_41115/m.129157 type:complete len:322 (-) Transcript_41115:1583-2548(-)
MHTPAQSGRRDLPDRLAAQRPALEERAGGCSGARDQFLCKGAHLPRPRLREVDQVWTHQPSPLHSPPLHCLPNRMHRRLREEVQADLVTDGEHGGGVVYQQSSPLVLHRPGYPYLPDRDSLPPPPGAQAAQVPLHRHRPQHGPVLELRRADLLALQEPDLPPPRRRRRLPRRHRNYPPLRHRRLCGLVPRQTRLLLQGARAEDDGVGDDVAVVYLPPAPPPLPLRGPATDDGMAHADRGRLQVDHSLPLHPRCLLAGCLHPHPRRGHLRRARAGRLRRLRPSWIRADRQPGIQLRLHEHVRVGNVRGRPPGAAGRDRVDPG